MIRVPYVHSAVSSNTCMKRRKQQPRTSIRGICSNVVRTSRSRLSRAARTSIRRNSSCQSSRTCELVLQFNLPEQLSICSRDDGRRTHRNGSYAHGQIKSSVDEKTAGNRNRDEVVNSRLH